MEDEFNSPESAVRENDALSENERQHDMSGESFSASSGEDETLADADPPIVVQGGGSGV